MAEKNGCTHRVLLSGDWHPCTILGTQGKRLLVLIPGLPYKGNVRAPKDGIVLSRKPAQVQPIDGGRGSGAAARTVRV